MKESQLCSSLCRLYRCQTGQLVRLGLLLVLEALEAPRAQQAEVVELVALRVSLGGGLRVGRVRHRVVVGHGLGGDALGHHVLEELDAEPQAELQEVLHLVVVDDGLAHVQEGQEDLHQLRVHVQPGPQPVHVAEEVGEERQDQLVHPEGPLAAHAADLEVGVGLALRVQLPQPGGHHRPVVGPGHQRGGHRKT